MRGIDNPIEYIGYVSRTNEKLLAEYEKNGNQLVRYVEPNSDIDEDYRYNPPETITARKLDLRMKMVTAQVTQEGRNIIFSAKGDKVEKSGWCRLDQLLLTKGQQLRLDIVGEVGRGCNVYFNPTDPLYRKRSNSFVMKEDTIIINGDPLYPTVLLSMMHEMGHRYLWEQMDESEKKAMIFDIENKRSDIEAAASNMSLERKAWAFALSKLRPFLAKKMDDPDEGGYIATRQFALGYIKEKCLRSYGRNALKLVDEIERDFEIVEEK